MFAPDPYLFYFTYTLLFALIFEANTYSIKERWQPPRALEAPT